MGKGMCAAVGAAMMFAAGASGQVVFELDYEYSMGCYPEGMGPWLRATFTTVGDGEVELYLESLLVGESERAKQWDFNVDPDFDVNALMIEQTGGVPAAWFVGEDAFTAAGESFFDIEFQWPVDMNDMMLGAGDTATFLLSGPGLTAESFLFMDDPFKCNVFTAAHVIGIAECDGEYGDFSGWLGDVDFCYTDWNMDCEVNIMDFVEYQMAFLAGDPRADCNEDGALNVLDFVCFQETYWYVCK